MTDLYASLHSILEAAAEQSSAGKGKERHACDGEAWEDQQICQIGRWMGGTAPEINGPIFQCVKKAIEATRLSPEAAERELLGAIVYAAAAVQLLRERKERGSK